MANEVEEVIIHGEGMAKEKDLPEIVKPLNDYTVEEKLDMALTMAESLADLHGYRDGVMYVFVIVIYYTEAMKQSRRFLLQLSTAQSELVLYCVKPWF